MIITLKLMKKIMIFKVFLNMQINRIILINQLIILPQINNLIIIKQMIRIMILKINKLFHNKKMKLRKIMKILMIRKKMINQFKNKIKMIKFKINKLLINKIMKYCNNNNKFRIEIITDFFTFLKFINKFMIQILLIHYYFINKSSAN